MGGFGDGAVLEDLVESDHQTVLVQGMLSDERTPFFPGDCLVRILLPTAFQVRSHAAEKEAAVAIGTLLILLFLTHLGLLIY